MKGIGARRGASVSLSLIAAVGLIAALVAGVTTANAAEHDAHGSHAAATVVPTTEAAAQLHDAMRKLWEDHVTWTRLAIVTFADGSDGFDTTAKRLLRNQIDIGNAVVPFYGAAAGHQLTKLLTGHIAIAVDLLQAAKAGDTEKFNAANKKWYANANQVADFLSAANPQAWPQAEMREAMKHHLDQTLAEADELSGKYAASVRDYEMIHAHILDMADLLSSGIVQQFPQKFA